MRMLAVFLDSAQPTFHCDYQSEEAHVSMRAIRSCLDAARRAHGTHPSVGEHGDEKDWSTTQSFRKRTPEKRAEAISGDKDGDGQGAYFASEPEFGDHVGHDTARGG